MYVVVWQGDDCFMQTIIYVCMYVYIYVIVRQGLSGIILVEE